MFSNKREPGTLCPMLGKKCVQHECAWYTMVRGHNPNTGKEVDEYGCAMAWMPVLMIENSQQQRQTGSAVESFRNEMVKANDMSRQLLMAEMQQRMLGDG